jgi:hypothetical protein
MLAKILADDFAHASQGLQNQMEYKDFYQLINFGAFRYSKLDGYIECALQKFKA